MKVYVLLFSWFSVNEWDQDTKILGIFDNIQKAQEIMKMNEYVDKIQETKDTVGSYHIETWEVM